MKMPIITGDGLDIEVFKYANNVVSECYATDHWSKDAGSAYEFLMRAKMKIKDFDGALESASKALYCWQKLEDI